MYRAAKDFKSYVRGEIKKGQKVDFNAAWEKAGLIELETKPEPEAKIKTKPEPKKAKKTK